MTAIFLEGYIKKYFPLSLVVFLIHVVLRDLLKELISIIFRPPTPKSLIITFRFILSPLPSHRKGRVNHLFRLKTCSLSKEARADKLIWRPLVI